MQYSGGVVQSKKEAKYLLAAFSTGCFILLMWLVYLGSAKNLKNPTPELINSQQPKAGEGYIPN